MFKLSLFIGLLPARHSLGGGGGYCLPAIALAAAGVIGLLLTPPSSYAKTPPPSLSIISPQERDQILGDTFTFSFIVSNFTFTDFESTKIKKPNTGHLHFWLDEDQKTLENAQKVLSHDAIVFKNVPPGPHTLTAEIVQNDHSSFSPKITSSINFTTHLSQTTTPTPTPIPIATLILEKITLKQLLTIWGVLLFIIGFILYLRFGRKRFLK
ncbi:hypothetical protein HY407_02520 [Candidatus Gottesmanbacteria bacterium]|nr:hypothetical protein [Candidatus Gottesmanbacteria bacterium]